MKTAPEKIVYKLSIEDLQYVAREILERELTSEEIAAVENALITSIGSKQSRMQSTIVFRTAIVFSNRIEAETPSNGYPVGHARVHGYNAWPYFPETD